MATIEIEDAGSHPELAKRLAKQFDDLINRIRNRAYELFQERGGGHGGDLEDWFRAEEELRLPAKLDVTQGPGSYHLRVSVPGFHAKDLKVYTLGNQLVLQGTTEERSETGGESATTTRSVFYSWPLPPDAIPDDIVAQSKPNSLEITVPALTKPEASKSEIGSHRSAEQKKATAI